MALSVEVGSFTASTGGTTTTVSTGFQPKALILFGHGKTGSAESAGSMWTIGFADDVREATWGFGGDDAAATSNTSQFFSNNADVSAVMSNGNTIATGGRVTDVAFNAAPNFVLTFSATPAAAWQFSYIILGGTNITNVFVGTTNVPTTAIPLNITGVGFQGDTVFLLNPGQAAGNAAHIAGGLGFATTSPGSIKQWATSFGANDGSVTTNVRGKSLLSSTKCVRTRTRTTASTDALVADFTQFTSDGFDLNFTTVSGVAWPLAYLVIKGGNWDAGVSAKPATATTQSVTGLAYVPKLLGLAMSTATAVDTYTANAAIAFGAGTSASARAYAAAYHNDTTNTVANSSGSSSAILHEENATANADLTTLGSDGSWTITWDATGTAYQVAWFTVGETPPAALLVGTTTGATLMEMSLAQDITFDASVSGAATTAGALTTSIYTAADVSGTAAATGALTTSILFVGAATGTAVGAADFTTTILFESEVDGTATGTGALTTQITMASGVSASAIAEALLTIAASMDASANGSATTSGILYLDIIFASSVSGSASTTGELILSGLGGSLISGTKTGFNVIHRLEKLNKL